MRSFRRKLLGVTSLMLATLAAWGRVNSQPKKALQGQAQETRSDTGILSGHISASHASITLFFCRGPKDTGVICGETSPGLFFLQRNDATVQPLPGETSCRDDLAAADKAIIATSDWAKGKHISEFVRFGKPDADGYFRIPGVKPGIYKLIARGRAGDDDTYWLQEIEVKPGQETTATVDSVQLRCGVEVTSELIR